MRRAILPLEPSTYRSNPLHAETRVFCETNCAADLWIEALHALGVDPTMALGFTLGTDFDGDQWRMFKFPAEDLRRLFGVEVDELNVWRPLVSHLDEQLALGRLVTVDVDAWHLPDTAGLTYRCAHQKTTIMVQMADPEAKTLGYFHNTGYFELSGEDFDGVTGAGTEDPARLPPYVESVRLDDLAPLTPDRVELAVELGRDHLARRPATNPIDRLAKRVQEDLGWLGEEGLDTFHRYAFGTIRQCGANAELAASFVQWLAAADPTLADAVEPFEQVATGMKSVEFLLARAVRGKQCDLSAPFSAMAGRWESAMALLDDRYGR